MRPLPARTYGKAARTTAAVPMRLTRNTSSHCAAGTSSSFPQESIPAAVKTPSKLPPATSASSATAFSTASVSAKSAQTCAISLDGGFLSMTSGVPP
ncbi:Uncharacterised protein [Mycobacteroides abscessus subsp. abscessus]|nr:Uncharacterised protein [Mycobacteroides abscessus subsp. abscessus]